jgi:hypothetical protein
MLYRDGAATNGSLKDRLHPPSLPEKSLHENHSFVGSFFG